MSTAQEILNYITEAGDTIEPNFQLYALQPDGFARLSLLTYEFVADDDGHKREVFKLDAELFERLREKLDEKNEEPGDNGEVSDLVEWLMPVVRLARLNALLEK